MQKNKKLKKKCKRGLSQWKIDGNLAIIYHSRSDLLVKIDPLCDEDVMRLFEDCLYLEKNDYKFNYQPTMEINDIY